MLTWSMFYTQLAYSHVNASVHTYAIFQYIFMESKTLINYDEPVFFVVVAGEKRDWPWN